MNKDIWMHIQADIATLSYAAADWIERFLDSRGFKLAIWAVLVIAVMYFSPVIFMIFQR